MALLKSRPYRLLMVTFDLTGTVAGDRRYAEADQALQLYGDLFKPVKQLRLLITRSPARVIKASLEQRIGRQSSVLVAPLTAIPAWRIQGFRQRNEWLRFVRAVEDHHLSITGLSSVIDSSS
jgi:hypothetical protein